MIYFSPSAADGRGAFFDDALFGARLIDVIDEVAQAAAVARAIDKDQRDYESHLQRAQIEAGEQHEPTSLHAAPRSAYQRRQRAAEANPIMKTVANPGCRIPVDAVEVSAEEHAELMRLQADGHDIVTGKGGRPVAVERSRTPEEMLEVLRKLRDRALASSDWTQAADAALSAAKKKAWAENRAKLRDLPVEILRAFKEHPPVGIVNPADFLPAPPK